jgi:OmpA-OmpF porin, OOP family
MFVTKKISFVSILCLAAVLPSQANAQGIFDQIRRSAERAVERVIDREVDRRTDKALTGVIECVAGDRACEEQAQRENKEVRYIPAGTASATGSASGNRASNPNQGVWVNYDFVPGDRVLFSEDFSADRVGNFPRRLGFISGNMEVVDVRGARQLRVTSPSAFEISLPQKLSERFTMEFDAFLSGTWLEFNVAFSEPAGGFRKSRVRASVQYLEGYTPSYIHIQSERAGIMTGTRWDVETKTLALMKETLPVRIMADGNYVKVYVNEHRIANIPSADLQRSQKIAFYFGGETRPEKPIFIGNIRVAESRTTIYDDLKSKGRASTQGILFDVGSARIKPESTPTLKEIAQVLKDQASIRLSIEGHTDNTGSGANNQKLSADRAASVVSHLVSQEGIAANRLESVGFGDTKPVADNGTAEGRQNNRRVELVVVK